MNDIDIKKLFDLAEDEVVELEDGLNTFAKLLQEKYDLRVFFERPDIPAANKKKMLADLLPDAEPIVIQVLHFLIDECLGKGACSLSEQMTKLLFERRNINYADVHTPYPLTVKENEEIEQFVGENAHLRVTIDPSLIAGVRILTYDGRLFDSSLKRAIERLKEELTYAA
ncbi:MAG TPA: F0F1 ATP synthase subunit delta [Candidatus Sulfotelmatobacter sp.]|nr:F0F1 ATP synthase subunit delta [Candidatus Sulfotelmatobacter sp.]